MKIIVLGTGMVGQTIAKKLNELGNTVIMATRNKRETLSRDEPARGTQLTVNQWLTENKGIDLVDFSDVPEDFDMMVNATNGNVSIDVLNQVGRDQLNGKVLLDLANHFDYSHGMPPVLAECNTTSLGERIQSSFPALKVVKSLNTMNCHVMMNPSLVSGDHNVFLSGDDAEAKTAVTQLLNQVGWPADSIIDLGDITTSRGVEMLLPLWLRLYTNMGHANFNFSITQ